MTTCWACELSLDPAWKYCIRCGVPVEHGDDPHSVGGRGHGALSPIAIFGVILGSLGVLLLGVGIVVYFAVA
jgi:hypothetical protein